MWTVPLPQATYCANPDLVEECIKICPAADVCAIGLRLGTYLQCIAFFVLTMIAPDEGGAESMWLSMSLSYAFILTNYVQVYLGSITLHHTVVITTIGCLPTVATLAAMNSLTSYRGLGKRGMLVLQIGLGIKAVLTALLWSLCLVAWLGFELSPPFRFRQSHCDSATAIVAFFVPVRENDQHSGRSKALLIAYTIFWALILLAGVYWSIKAPIVLRRKGGNLRPKPERGFRDPKFFGGPAQREALKEKERKQQRNEFDYDTSSADDDYMLMTPLRSIAKDNKKTSTPVSVSPQATHNSGVLFSDPIFASSRSAQTPQQASQAWSAREIELRHHFVIWPAVAVLLAFTIMTAELQIAMNDIYAGEMHWDFPGTLTFLLALPTVWSVIKALLRIREGRRPKPSERVDESFLELGHANKPKRSASRRSSVRSERSARALLSSAEEEEEEDSREKRKSSRQRSRGA